MTTDGKIELEEIIVTVQRRAEPLQSIGVSASVMDGDTIRAGRIQQALDNAGRVPGLSTVNATHCTERSAPHGRASRP